MKNVTTIRLRRNAGISKKTPEVLATIEKNLNLGVSLKGAAAAAGSTEVTIHAWKRKDPAVAEMIDRACSESESTLVQLAADGCKKDGRIALMMLERRFPDQWGRIDRMAIKTEVCHSLVIPEAQACKIRDMALKKLAKPGPTLEANPESENQPA